VGRGCLRYRQPRYRVPLNLNPIPKIDHHLGDATYCRAANNFRSAVTVWLYVRAEASIVKVQVLVLTPGNETRNVYLLQLELFWVGTFEVVSKSVKNPAALCNHRVMKSKSSAWSQNGILSCLTERSFIRIEMPSVVTGVAYPNGLLRGGFDCYVHNVPDLKVHHTGATTEKSQMRP